MPLFEDVKYYCASTLSQERSAHLALLFNANGASAASREDATHIITNEVEFEGSQTAGKAVAVVTVSLRISAPLILVSKSGFNQEYWVERSLVLGKIQP